MTLINKVPKLQNFAAKVAMGSAKKIDHAAPILKELKWVSVKGKHKLDTCTPLLFVVYY